MNPEEVMMHAWRRLSVCPALAGALACSALVAALALASAPAGAQPGGRTTDDPCVDGLRLFKAHDSRAAEPLLQRCAAERPSAEALACLAAIASLSGRSGLAGEYASRAVDLDSTNVDARYWLGRASLESGDKAGARRAWDAGLRLATDHAGILEGLARLAADRGEVAQAYSLLSRLVRIGKAEGWTHRMLADLARRKGLWADALQHWRDAGALEGEDASSLVTMVELAILAGDTTTAMQAGRRAVALKPDGPSYGGLGEALFAARRYGEAGDVLRRAVELEPDAPRHRFNLANVAEVLDRTEEAEDNFSRYVKLQPQDPRGHFNYGIHLQNLGRPLEALQQVTEAARLAPRMQTAQVVQGQLLDQLGRYAEALAVIDTLLAHDRQNRSQLSDWRTNVQQKQIEESQAQQAGLVHLLHIVTGDSAAVRHIQRELGSGADFADLATRYSTGPTAGQGGDIGRVAPADLVEPLCSAVRALALNAITPLLESRGQYHFFKRVR